MYKITKFESVPTKGKKPISPYGDNTFTFCTMCVNDPMDLFRVMSKEFILNITLDLKEPLRSFRRKKYLNDYYPDTVNYIIIDVDHIYTKQNQLNVLNYFKKYKCLIGESRSCNNIDNFNLKGFLFLEPTKIENLKPLVEQLYDDLKKYGDIDFAVSHKVKLNAPMGKIQILLDSNGELYKFVLKNRFENSKTFDNLKDIKLAENIDFSGVDTIEKLCLRVFESAGFEALQANEFCITFKHPSEVKSPGGFFWFYENPYMMHHYNDTRTFSIFEQVSKLPEAKELLKKDIKYESELQHYNTSTTLIPVNQRFLQVTDIIKDHISDFLEKKDGLFSIKSPMGTAKSEVIDEIIKQAQELDMRVLICSNRISVAQDFSKKYNIKLYNRDKYNTGDSLIVQYDSLWRYNIRLFEVVILDEFISVLLHSRSTLNNTSINLSKLFACTKKKLVIADAFLTGYENKLLSHKKDNIYMLQNEYRDDVKLYEYENYNCFVQSILTHCKKLKKVTISCTSLNVIHALKLLLTKYELNVVTLTSDTPQATKELIYKIFESSDNDKFDVLIYSPTLTVGVSNLNNIDVHFHYDSANTCDVISSLQMIKRTRKAKEIHYYIKNSINFLQTSFDGIRDMYLENIGKQIELNFLFELNDYGEPKLSKLGKNAIYIDLFRNILEYNHKKAFTFLLQYQFLNDPEIIDKKFESNILTPYLKEVQRDNKEILKESIEQYFMLSGFDISKVSELVSENSVFEVIQNLESQLKNDTSINIKKDILLIEVQNKGFLDRCKKYIILSEYSKNLNKTAIQIEISNAITNNSINDVKFWNSVLKYIIAPIKDEYKISDIKNKIKELLTKSGYVVKSRNCERFYGVDDNVLKFKDYLDV